MRLHHVADGSTGPGYSLMCFDIKIYLAKMTHTSFIRIRHCLLTLCLRLIEPRFGKIVLLCNKFIYGGQHLIELTVACDHR